MNDELFLSFLRDLFVHNPSGNLRMQIEQAIYRMGHGEVVPDAPQYSKPALLTPEWSEAALAKFNLAIAPDPSGG
jgi:hypothetical protein